MKKNLVLGVAKSYGWDILEPFVLSCKKNCPSAELVLFVDDISDFTCAQLERSGVLLGNFPDELKSGIPNNTRWKIFADFLEIHGGNYEQIFISDTRDVIFQSDIFAAFEGFKNYLGLATEADDIRGSKTGDRVNYGWLEDTFGKDAIIGTTAEMKIFCRKMFQSVFAVESRVNFRIHDQAVANYLVYNNFIPVENLFDVGDEIFTMGLAKDFFVRGGKFLRGDKIPAVVHQYDRCEDGIWIADEIYRAKNFSSEECFGDTRSIIEQATCLVFVEKFSEAERLLKNELFAGTNLENYVGVLIRLWEIVMRKTLSQESGSLELLAQSMLKTVKNFSSGDMRKICMLLKLSREGHHLVDEAFKNSLENNLLRTAEQCLTVGEEMQYNFCIDLLKLLDVTI